MPKLPGRVATRFAKRVKSRGTVLFNAYRMTLGRESGAKPFPGSAIYWESRYARGGCSGPGSYGKLAIFKATFINKFLDKHAIDHVIEFGCGDGNQIQLIDYPSYTGFDVSQTSIDMCRSKFSADRTKSFKMLYEYNQERADLALSLDVIFHLVEDHVFEAHMQNLFEAAKRYVIIYSSNVDDDQVQSTPHVRHRRFTEWVSSNCDRWNLSSRIPNKYPYRNGQGDGSFCAFYIYRRAR